MKTIYIKWALLMVRRNLARVSFWVLVVITALIFQTTSYIVMQYSKSVTVPVCNEGGEIGKKICEDLLKGKYDGIDFVMCNDAETVELMVIQSKAPCGFVFTGKMDKIGANSKIRDCIVMYQSPSALSGYMIKELVFATVLKETGPALFADYLEEIGAGDEAKEYAAGEYERYLNSNDISIFETKILSDADSADERTDYRQNCVIYIAMILVFMAELAAVYVSAGNTDKNFLSKFTKRDRFILSMEHALISAIMIVFIAFLCYKSLTLLA